MKRPMAAVLALASALTAGVLAFEGNSDPWTPSDVVSVDDFAQELKQGGANDRLLLHVGFPVLYRASHIPGSQYAGPGAKAEGIAELKKVLADVPRSRRVVLYCGCCPWSQCPNIRPAWRAAHEMGFHTVKVVMIPTNIRTDWSDKGYPIERSHADTQ